MRAVIDVRRKEFARLKSEEFSHFLEQIEDGTSDSTIMRYLVPLFFKIYEMHLEHKYLSKAQACRYIPLKHAVSCQKYMLEAKHRGYIDFERDESDKRKQIIKPGTALLAFVERELDRTITAYDAIKQLDDTQSLSGNIRPDYKVFGA